MSQFPIDGVPVLNAGDDPDRTGLAPLLWADGNPVGDRTPQDLVHGIGIFSEVEVQPGALGIQFRLADAATELWTARLMLYEAAHDPDTDLKSLHTRCAMTKLYCSEMASRVCDRVLQIFGGRGYMRSNPAEHFFRELRVDRIWEGSSEIQRMVVAKSLLKRGLEAM